MARKRRMQRLAVMLRRFPWSVGLARRFWQMAQPKVSLGVVGVVFNADGNVLLVEHVFHPYVPWGLPGGWVERGEDPAATVQRELREELELEIEVGPLLGVSREIAHHLDMAYLCYPRGTVGTLSYELLSHRWADPDDLPPTHPFHQTAIHHARHLLTQQPKDSAS